MVFSYNWLKDYVGRLPEPEKTAELLTMHSFEVGEVKKTGADYALDIDVLPNRGPDCFSHFGIAREIAAITNSKLRPINIKQAVDAKIQTKDFVTVEVKDKKACPRYTAKVVADVKVGPSPKWLKDRLRVCGLNSINNIVDIANYVMLETGQPLHAFDGQKLAGNRIVVRFARNREKIVTLDEQKFDLDSSVLVIADAEKPVAIAGIKGGKLPEIDKKTKVVVLEAANFDGRVIRQGSKKLNLKTDASLRFEHGLDPNLTEMAVIRTAQLIQKIAGGKIARGSVDIYPKKVYPKRVKLDQKYLTSLLGKKILPKEINNILKRLGFVVRGSLVTVPTFRQDIFLPEDLIEEVVRIYGYDKIPSVFPIVSLAPSRRNLDIFWENKTKDIMKEFGFTEAYNYSFVSQGSDSAIELENPMSQEHKYLRENLISNLKKNVKFNKNNFKDIRLFEIGKVFSRPAVEESRLAGINLLGSFYDIKGIVEGLLNKLGISDIKYIENGRQSASVEVGQEKIGVIGENYFELNFDKVKKLASEEVLYRPISRYPSAVRDLAILVPRQTKVVQVLNKINIAGGKLVRDVDLFDIYQGEELPQGKKNLAFHIVYQSETRTLKSKEVDEIHQKIIKTLEKESTWQVRK